MAARDLPALPGAEIVLTGLRDLHEGRESIEALLVLVGAPKLRSLGVHVPDSPHAIPPEHQLYERLDAVYGRGAHSQYNALIGRLVSFERALACVRA